MQNTSIKFSASKLILITIIAILAGGAGYYIYSDYVSHRKANIGEESTTVVDSEKNQQLEQLEQPDLDRPVNITVNIPEQTKELYRKKIEELSNALKENPDLFDGWLDLGINRQNIGDYEGAREIWEYASYIRPQNSISFNNLGFLYGYYLKNNQKAEENYLKALENGPEQVYIYRSVFEFYRDVMKDMNKAKAILQKGIELNPETSQDLQILLQNL